jgi:hypothetical protein
MRKFICINIIVLFFFLTSFVTLAVNYSNSLMFKLTVWQDDVETEVEFENPSDYEWEVGSTVLKGTEAKIKVQRLYEHLNISKDSKVDQLKVNLEKHFPNMQRFNVRWIDTNGNLYTWHWSDQIGNEN